MTARIGALILLLASALAEAGQETKSVIMNVLSQDAAAVLLTPMRLNVMIFSDGTPRTWVVPSSLPPLPDWNGHSSAHIDDAIAIHAARGLPFYVLRHGPTDPAYFVPKTIQTGVTPIQRASPNAAESGEFHVLSRTAAELRQQMLISNYAQVHGVLNAAWDQARLDASPTVPRPSHDPFIQPPRTYVVTHQAWSHLKPQLLTLVFEPPLQDYVMMIDITHDPNETSLELDRVRMQGADGRPLLANARHVLMALLANAYSRAWGLAGAYRIRNTTSSGGIENVIIQVLDRSHGYRFIAQKNGAILLIKNHKPSSGI